MGCQSELYAVPVSKVLFYGYIYLSFRWRGGLATDPLHQPGRHSVTHALDLFGLHASWSNRAMLSHKE